MKKTLFKDTLRSISANRLRFLSIIIIVALGISFFIGIKSSSPAMGYSANEYFRINNLLDLRVTSSVPFTGEDVEKIEQIDAVDYVVRSKYVDVVVGMGSSAIVDANGMELICRVSSLNVNEAVRFTETGEADDYYVNRVILKDGRYPEVKGECLVDAAAANKYEGLEIGSVIKVSSEDSAVKDSLKMQEFKVVGTVESPMYISTERGTTQVGSGSLGGFIYVDESVFKTAEINEIFVKIKYDDVYDKFSGEYKSTVDAIAEKIRAISSVSMSEQLSDLKVEYNTKIFDKQIEIRDYEKSSTLAVQEKQKEIDEFKAYVDSEDEILKQKKEQNDTKKNSLKTALDNQTNTYNTIKTTYESNLKELEGQSSQINGYTELKKQYDELNEQLANDKTELESLAGIMNSTYQQLEDRKSEEANALTKKDDAYSLKLSAERRIPEIDGEIKALEASKLDPDENTDVGLIDHNIKALKNEKDRCNAEIKAYDTALSDWESKKANTQIAQSAYDAAESSYSSFKTSYERNELKLKDYKKDLDDLTSQQGELTALNETVEKQKQELDALAKTVTDCQINYSLAVRNGNREIMKAQYDLDNAKSRYYTVDNELMELKTQVEKEKASLSVDLKKLQNTLNNIDSLTWQTTTQPQLVGHVAFEKSMDNILSMSNIFPIIFFVTAMIACFVIMMKNIEEGRGSIGLLKAFGYSNFTIMGRYMLYANLAWLGGAFLGGILGTCFVPSAVYSVFDIVYTVPNVGARFDFKYIFIGLTVSFATTMVATFMALVRELKMYPAELMRPRMIGYNRRSLLERMPDFWGRLPYGMVLLIRTVIRSRKRVAVGSVAIACCTALILSSLGLLNSVTEVSSAQYGSESVFRYDVQFVLNAVQNPEESAVLENVIEDENVTAAMLISNISMSVCAEENNIDSKSVHVVVPAETENLSSYINLEIIEGSADIASGGAVLSQKLAQDLDVGAGDTVYLTGSDNMIHTVKVIGVVKNYIDHYAYISDATYRNTFFEAPQYKYLVCTLKDYLTSDEISAFAAEYLKTEDVAGAATSEMMSRTADTAINQVMALVVIFILSACLLAMIVMYTTSNVNISERTHEIANIKVIGFSDGEVLIYIVRENIVSTAVGIILGLISGIFLHKALVNLISVENVMYGSHISLWSFFATVGIIVTVAVVAALPIFIKINKVKMAETLKSVE